MVTFAKLRGNRYCRSNESINFLRVLPLSRSACLSVNACITAVCLFGPAACLYANRLSACQQAPVCQPSVCMPSVCLTVCQPFVCLSVACLPAWHMSICQPSVSQPAILSISHLSVYRQPVHQAPVCLLAGCLSACSCLPAVHLTDLCLTGEPVFSRRLQLQRYRQRSGRD